MFISQNGSSARWLSSVFVAFGLVTGTVGYASPLPDGSQAIAEIYKQAVASPIRTDEDRSADAKRKPLEFLQFTNAQPGMRVLDIAAGGGYTTQLLALVVGSKGTVWAQGTQSPSPLEERLTSHPQANIVSVVQPFEDPIPYMPVDRTKMNQRLFNALKTGGHLIVMDHSAKAGSGISAAKSLHRIDEKIVLDEFKQAGFKLEQEGDFLRNPADPREQAFFKMKIPTDKFALRFVKP
jgi:predicted methyltransferase